MAVFISVHIYAEGSCRPGA